MVISIDTIRYGGKLGTTDTDRTAVAAFEETMEPQDSELLAPARGTMCGVLLSCALWVGVAAAARALLTLMR